MASGEEDDGEEGEFGEAGHDAEGEGFGVIGSKFGTVAAKAGDDAGEPELGGFAGAVVEKPHDEGEGGKEASEDDEGGGGEDAVVAVEGADDEEAGGGEEKKGDDADAGDEAADEVSSFALNMFAGGFVIEEEETAEGELEGGVDEGG